MNVEKWIVAHFSPTGGTKKIADAIAEGFGTALTEMDLTNATHAVSFGENDALLVVLPVFAGRVPHIAFERLAVLKGHSQKAVAVVVYGNREFDDALLETKDALETNGFRVIAAAAFVAEHSILRSVAACRPDRIDIQLCRQFANNVMAKPDDSASVSVPGSYPYIEPHPAAFHPAANENCINCGTCATACPVGAIPKDDPKRANASLCINCMRCVQLCPVQCRAMPAPFLTFITKLLKENASGYKTPTIFL